MSDTDPHPSLDDAPARVVGPSSAFPSSRAPRRRRRRWPWAVAGSLALVLVAAWVSLDCVVASWVAHHGTVAGGEPSVTALGYPATEVDYAPGLPAWYTPPRAGEPVAVIVHGFQANRAHVLSTALALYPRGWGLLLPDLGYVSGASAFGGGDREADQVIEAVDFARARSHAPVVLIGYSEGGAESILAAERGAKVVAVIADSAPVSLMSIATERSGLPSWLLAATPIVYPWFSGGGHLEDLASVLPDHYSVPTLIIQGAADTTVPPSQGAELATLTHGTLWSVPGAGHDDALAVDTSAYIARVTAFVAAARRHAG